MCVIRESITENRFARLDESDSIRKRKSLGTTYVKHSPPLRNSYHNTYALLHHSHKCRPPWGVWSLQFALPKTKKLQRYITITYICTLPTAGMSTASFYTLTPLSRHFGAEVHGLDLSKINLLNPKFLDQLRDDIVQHRVLLFRKQELTGQRQVDISNTLGTVASTFYKHPMSPHADIFRVSNNESEGCRNVGRSGYHVDGTFLLTPFTYQTMYFPSASEGGDTYFIPLKELYESASEDMRKRWDKLWMVTSRRGAPVHPLVYQHPFRHEPTMLFHCGGPFVEGWFENKEGQEEEEGSLCFKDHDLLPAWPVQQELTEVIESNIDDLGLRMKWEKGDFLINDNLGLAHYATEGTQEDWRKVGLRILHRTTIVGGEETTPQKTNGQVSFTR